MNNKNIASKQENNNNLYCPSVDIFEEDNKVNLVAELAGIKKDELDLSIENNTLTISAKMKEENFEDYDLVYSEYKTLRFKRSFTLSEELNKDELEAIFKNGILSISIPKKKKSPAKKIEVKLAWQILNSYYIKLRIERALS